MRGSKMSEGDDNPLRQLSDEKLREMIVNEKPYWQDAYRELLVERHWHIVEDVASRFNLRPLGLSNPEDLHGELLLYLRGPHGFWTHLRAWDPQKGSLDGWLFRVVYHLCLSTAPRK